MKKLSLAWTMFVAVTLAACGGANEKPSASGSPATGALPGGSADTVAPSAEVLRGAEVYRACVGCHGTDPANKSLGVDKGVSVAALEATYQKVSAMGAFSSSLSAANNADLAAYISSRVSPPTAGAPAPSLTPAPAPESAPVAANGCEAAVTPRRLTQVQYINAMTQFVSAMTGDAALAATVPAVVRNTAQLPPDLPLDPEFPKHKGFTRLDQAIGQNRGTAVYAMALNLSASMTGTPARLGAVLSQCTANPQTCLDNMIRKAGRMLYRKPLADNEIAALRNVAGGSTSAASVQKVLGAMMASPQVYFVIERAVQSSQACAPLTGPELASRLALHFWDSIPDQALNDAADKPASDPASLLHASGYAAQVTRMVNDAQADAAMRSFFREWFRLDELTNSPLNGAVGTVKFDRFAAGFQPTAQTTTNAINEVLDMVSHVSKTGTLQDIFTNRQSFARTDDIATLYKTPRWDGNATPPTFTEPEREGLFGRIAFIANGSTDTTLPISRSVKILGALTCQNLGLPAIDQSPPAGAVLTGLITTRTRTERVTEQAGTGCTACHQPQINPWGFALERFDALGRVRARETVRDASGNELGQLDINTATQVQLQGVAPRAVASLIEAQRYMLDSGQMERCFARNYVRHTFKRTTTAGDNALIDALSAQARQGLKLRELFAQMALRPEFKTVKGAAK